MIINRSTYPSSVQMWTFGYNPSPASPVHVPRVTSRGLSSRAPRSHSLHDPWEDGDDHIDVEAIRAADSQGWTRGAPWK
jgi:hypothetical protein